MYILLENSAVKEIIPDFDPVFPGIPITERYAPDFVKKLICVSDDTEVGQNWTYDGVKFSPPEPPETDEEKAKRIERQIAELENELTLTKQKVAAVKTGLSV